MKRISLLVVLAVLVLSACTTPGPAPAPTTGPQATALAQNSPLPTAGANTFTSPLPAGAATTAPNVAAVVVTPSAPDRATITGILMTNSSNPVPVTNTVVALASILPNATGTPSFAAFDRTTAPKSETDASGRFVFTDVKIQTYALILDRFYATYMLNDPKTGKDLLFNPQPGKVLDVGNLVYETLPGTGPDNAALP